MPRRATYKCPKCDSGDIVPIEYGYPSWQMQDDSLLEKIETLLLDRSLRETFSKNLKEITHINSWERIAQETIDLYSKICNVAVHDHKYQDGSER